MVTGPQLADQLAQRWESTHGGGDVTDEVLVKECKKCRKSKAIDEFGTDKKAPDGHSYWCKECVRERNRANYQKNKSGSNPATRPPRKPRAPKPDPQVVPDPPQSATVDAWRQVFSNPTLDQLEALKSFLGVVSLDEAARISRVIASA